MATPTLIGMPDPPSNPDTPTEAPGTPNSTTTSLSALSTTAIKDGHRGTSYPHDGRGHHHTPSSNTLEAERADRISRLAGLERVSTVRPSPTAAAGAGQNQGQIPGYFDQNGNPVYMTKMSTVGSASATGSVGGRTTTNTWASGSTGRREQDADGDEDMSVDMSVDERDRDAMSTSAMDEDGMSDDASLVGFGEGAGSTVSGPIYSRREAPRSGLGQMQNTGSGQSTPGVERERRDARMLDGVADDALDTTNRGASRDSRALGSPEEGGSGLGKFYFEEKK